MSDQKEEKKILKLRFNNSKTQVEKPKTIEQPEEKKIFKPQLEKQEDSEQILKDKKDSFGNLPKIITTNTTEFKNYRSSTAPFKKRTFIPKNENKFAPKTVKKDGPDNKRFIKTNNTRPKSFQPFNPAFAKPSTPNVFTPFSKEKKNTFSNKLDIKKRKNTKKESFKPKIEETSKILSGNTFIGKIEYNTLEDPEFIKLKRTKKNNILQKTRIFEKKTIKLTQNSSLKDIANQLSIKTNELMREANINGVPINSEIELIDIDLLELLLSNMGHNVIREDNIEKTKLNIFKININPETAVARPPIVSIIGHVDHGKTSLIDSILKSNLTRKEVGGITQTTKAYNIKTKHGDITIIDTPGHAAFTKMMERNIKITDIAILIISSVDGVQDQTIEAIKLLNKIKKPFLIALTKQDLPGADIDKIKQSLAQHDVLVKDYGGDIELIPVSSKTHFNIDLLLETISLYGQVLDIKTNNEAKAVGVILESKIDPKIGIVTNILIKQGNLKVGDIIVANACFGKVKRIMNADNKIIKQTFAGDSIEILGFNSPPAPGANFGIAINNENAIEITEYQKSLELKKNNNFINLIPKDTPTLNLILKTDSQGTIEALKEGLNSLNTTHSLFNIIDSNIGAIKETDLELAKISNSIIIAFNINIDQNTRGLAKTNNIKILENNIIYHLLDDINKELESIVKLVEKETYSGTAMIQMIFKSSKLGNIAGCIVKDGKIVKNNSVVKILRKEKIIYEGPLKSLKRFKDDVKEVSNGSECGIIVNYENIHINDIIKCYIIEYVKPE